MNANYKQISSSDAAQMLGVTRGTVGTWCRHGIINFIDVSEPSSNVPRYVLTEDEVLRIKRAMRRHGKFTWTKHYNKDYKSNTEPTTIIESIDEEFSDNEIDLSSAGGETKGTDGLIDTTNQDRNSLVSEHVANVSNYEDDLSPDDIANEIVKINEIKKRLIKLDTEKESLQKDLDLRKQRVMSYIEI